MAAAAASRKSNKNDGDKEKIIPFPKERVVEPSQQASAVADWLGQVLVRLQETSRLFNRRITPTDTDISDTYSKLDEVIESIHRAIMLVADLQLDQQSRLMPIWTRLENPNEGIRALLDMIGEDLLDLSLAGELREGHGKLIQRVRANFRSAERTLKGLIKQLRSI